MSFPELLILGIGLSMDAVAVTLTNRIVFRSATKTQLLLMPVLFGLFQGLMPSIGYFTGDLFSDIIRRFSSVLVFIILGAIGGKMIYDGIKKDEERSGVDTILTTRLLLAQALATSIDALAVGIGFSAVQTALLPAVLTIGVTTALLCALAVAVGQRFGDFLGARAHFFGGAVLILLGIKSLLGI